MTNSRPIAGPLSARCMRALSDTPNDAVNTVLLTLGRLPVALELSRAFQSQGYRVVVAEPFGWHLCRLSRSVARSYKVTAPRIDAERYREQLLRIITSESIDLVVPVSEEILHVAPLQNRLPTGVRMLCAPQAMIESLHDKWQFNQLARTLELAVPQTVLANKATASDLLHSGPWVLKPRLSCAGGGIRFIKEQAELQQTLAESTDDTCVLQRQLPGPECCTLSTVASGVVMASVAYRSLATAASVAICFEAVRMPPSIADAIKRFVATINHDGLIAFDWMQDTHGEWQAIECNPRSTSGLHVMSPEQVAASFAACLSSADDHRSQDEARKAAHQSADTVSIASEDSPLQPTGVRRQEFWSHLTHVEARLLRGRFDRAGFHRLLSTRDICWRSRDPLPSLAMPLVSMPLLWRAFRAGRPVVQIAMQDMGQYDERHLGRD